MVRLTKSRQKEIDDTISNLLLKTDKTIPEEGILDIVKALNITVNIVDFKKEMPEVKEKIVGMIRYGNGEKPVILLNKEEIDGNRRNFTLAHELGHYLLHKPTIEGRFRLDIQYWDADPKCAKEESEANYFAASLLVPEYKLKIILRDIDEKEISSYVPAIAKYFAVSKAVITTRIKWLKENV